MCVSGRNLGLEWSHKLQSVAPYDSTPVAPIPGDIEQIISYGKPYRPLPSCLNIAKLLIR
jgi:hypothetical protein